MSSLDVNCEEIVVKPDAQQRSNIARRTSCGDCVKLKAEQMIVELISLSSLRTSFFEGQNVTFL